MGLGKAIEALKAFSAMARAARFGPVDLPADRFPAGALEGPMRSKGVSALRFEKAVWRDRTEAGEPLAAPAIRGVFELDGGAKESFSPRGELWWIGSWAASQGLRLELRAEGAAWVAPSARAARRAKADAALGEGSLRAAASELSGLMEWSSSLRGGGGPGGAEKEKKEPGRAPAASGSRSL